MTAKAVTTNSDKYLPRDIAESEQAGVQKGMVHERKFSK